MNSDGGISLDFFEKVYITPWCRIGPFLIGMITKLILEYYHSSLILHQTNFLHDHFNHSRNDMHLLSILFQSFS